MPGRVVTATAGGVLFLIAWVIAAMMLSDHVMPFGTAAQFVYFALAGSAWVLPITWLMLWASRSPSNEPAKTRRT